MGFLISEEIIINEENDARICMLHEFAYYDSQEMCKSE